MQDIDQFSEEKMSASNLHDFTNSLPPQLRSKYIKAFDGKTRYMFNVVQGYKGPSRLTIPESTYSETEEEYLGVQKISFWYASSKNLNWIPVAGTAAWVALRLMHSYESSMDWHYMYFNASTGEMLDEKVAKELMEKTKDAEKKYEEGEKLYLKEKYEEAFKKYEFAFETCITGYKNQTKFKYAMDKAQIKVVSQLYKKADDFSQDRKYQEALELYQKADRLSQNTEELQQSRDKQALTMKKIGDQLRSNGSLDEARQTLIEARDLTTNEEIKHKIDDSFALIYAKEGENLFNDGKYEEAKLKFELASSKTKQLHDAENFKFWIERIKNELEVVLIKDQADLLLNNKNYEQAIAKYRQAKQKTLLDSEKLNYESKIQEIERTLRDLNASQQTTEDQKKVRALDLVNKALVLILDGNALSLSGENGAAIQKYDEAMKMFEEASKYHSMNIMFNSLLKLIDAYYNVNSYEDAVNVIEKGKAMFPNKLRDFDKIKQKIDSRECSLNYMNRFMMEEESRDENQGRNMGNLSFSP